MPAAFDERGIEPLDMPDLQQRFVLTGEADELPGLVEVGRERLLDQQGNPPE